MPTLFDFRFCIPSYQRADNQPTLKLLAEYGVPKSRITISTQTEEDYEAYQQRYGNLHQVVYYPKTNVSGNMNTLLDHRRLGAKIVFLDDDIKRISKLQPDGTLKDLDSNGFLTMLQTGFALAKKHHTVGFGIYPVYNAFFMKHSYYKRAICIATVLGVVNTLMRFDERINTKQDYDFCCNAIKRYGAFIRLNDYAPDAAHYSRGGCEENWKDKEGVVADANKLLHRYPDLLRRNPKRPGEVLMRKYE